MHQFHSDSNINCISWTRDTSVWKFHFTPSLEHRANTYQIRQIVDRKLLVCCQRITVSSVCSGFSWIAGTRGILMTVNIKLITRRDDQPQFYRARESRNGWNNERKFYDRQILVNRDFFSFGLYQKAREQEK